MSDAGRMADMVEAGGSKNPDEGHGLPLILVDLKFPGTYLLEGVAEPFYGL